MYNEEDETEEEKVERVLAEVEDGQHAVALEEYIIKKTDFLNDLIHGLNGIHDDKALGEFVRHEMNGIIGDFAEDYHG